LLATLEFLLPRKIGLAVTLHGSDKLSNTLRPTLNILRWWCLHHHRLLTQLRYLFWCQYRLRLWRKRHR
jgi:hypothetical protein